MARESSFAFTPEVSPSSPTGRCHDTDTLVDVPLVAVMASTGGHAGVDPMGVASSEPISGPSISPSLHHPSSLLLVVGVGFSPKRNG